MDLRHLNIFITVCDCGSMTRAAERLYMTQPSVSQAVAELERDYGVRLFERLNHRLYLTAAGDHLRSYARHILNLSEQARKELLDLSQGGSIRIGATLTIGAHLLPGLVASFRPRWPEADIYTQVDNTSVIEKLILEDRLDLGLVEGPVYSEHVVEQVLQDDDLVIICSPQHALAVSGRLHVSDLAGWGILIREQGSGTRDVFEHAMQAAGVPWKINGVYNNIEAIKQAVRADLGLGVVSRISVLEEVGRGQVVPLAVQGLSLKRKFNLIYHRQKYFTPVMQAFAEHCIAAGRAAHGAAMAQ